MTRPINPEKEGVGWTPQTHQDLLNGAPGGGLDRLTQLSAGNHRIIDNPGLLSALNNANATPEQANQINTLLSGFEAQKQVELARAQAQKVVLSAQQQAALDQMGVNYADVNQSAAQMQATGLVQTMQSQGLQVQKDQYGNVQLDGNGQPIVIQSEKPKTSWWQKTFHVTSKVVTAPWHLVNSGAQELGALADGGYEGAFGATHEAAMKAAGYDPSSPLSTFSYYASGKAQYTPKLTKLMDDWNKNNPGAGMNGNDAVLEAVAFTSNPNAYRQSIETNPNLTIEQKKQKIDFIDSNAFQALAKRVGGNTESYGNAVAKDLNIDPAKHPTLYSSVSAGTDFAASLFADPLIAAGKVNAAYRTAQIGIKGADSAISSTKIGDMFRAADNMTAADKLKNPYVAGLARRWNDILDTTSKLSHEDSTVRAGAYAKLQAQYPEVLPIVPDLTGASKLDLVDGKLVSGPGTPITNLTELGDYLSSKMGMVRFMQGKAALESNYMPGVTSLFGYRALRGAVAGKLASVSEKINLSRLDKVGRILPDPIDAIDEDGQVIAAQQHLDGLDPMHNSVDDISSARQVLADARSAAAKRSVETTLEKLDTTTPVGRELQGILRDTRDKLDTSTDDPSSVLASARRAVQNSAVIRGEVQQNMLRRGTPTGQGFNLRGVQAARLGQLGRRLTTLLPRNTVFTLGDPQSVEKFNRYAQTFLNKGDAALLAAKWASGDEASQRALISAIQLQTAHAAGFGYTEGGQKALREIADLYDNTTGDLAGLKSVGQKFTPVHGLDIVEDPALGGQSVHLGLHPSDVQKTWVLPAFGKMLQDANRLGIWNKTFGRVMTHAFTDQVMHGFKMLQLFKPSTWTRNMLEGWLNAAFRGEAGGGIRAKALMTEAEIQVEKKIRDQAAREGWDKVTLNAALKKAAPTPRKFLTAKVPHLIMGQWYRSALGRMLGDDEADKYVIDLLNQPGEAQRMMHGFGMQHLLADVDPTAMGTRLDHYEAGLASTEMKWKKEIDGYEAQPTSGFEGAQRYVNALGRRLEMYPEYGRALLDAAKSGDGDLTALKDVIANDSNLKADIGRLTRSSRYQDADGSWNIATTDEERQTAQEQLLHRAVDDVRFHMTDQNGNWIQKVDDHFRETGHVPDASWVQRNLSDDERAKLAVAPHYIATPLRPGASGFVNGLLELADKGYVRLVEDPIQRTTSMPIFLHNYGQARLGLSEMEKTLVSEHGFTPEAADALMKETAMKQAWIKTESMIDDPGAKTQLDIVGRNFFAYSRAVQAMVRRWGQAIVQDPTRMVKGALAVQAAQHSGLIWTDQYGEVNFTYPGVGPFIHGMTELGANVPFFGGFTQLPTTPDLTGKVVMAVPGLENPFKLSLSPIVNVPFRMVTSLITGTPLDVATPFNGAHLSTLAEEIDRGVNGSIGAGEVGSQFEPALLRNYFRAFSTDQQNGMLASATTGALANLIATGQVPPENATNAEKQNFLDKLRINVRNHLFLRAVFGMYAPAAPSSPTEETSKTGKADYAFSAAGIHGLSAEFTQMLNDLGGDYNEAVQLWTALHPNELVYTQGKSTAVDNRAYLPATQTALEWADNNAQFIHKYSTIAGYFVPNTPGAFDSTAYALQVKMGLRQKRTPEEFLNTFQVSVDNAQYKAMTTQLDNQIAAAQAQGDDGAVSNLKKLRAQKVKEFNALHPLHQAEGTYYQQKATDARDALATLRDLVQDPSAPSDIPVSTISDMLASYDNYEKWKASVGNSTTAERDARTVMAAAYSKHMISLAQSSPGLADLYDGVFRQLDNKLTDLNAEN